MSRIHFTRKRIIQVVGAIFNFVLPWALYRLAEPHVSQTHALMVSAAGPAAWSVVQLVRTRQFDTWSLIMLGGLGLSAAAFAVGGSPKMFLFRESLVTGLIGLVLVCSAIIRRPLFYALAAATLRGMSPAGGRFARAAAEFESFSGEAWFRHLMTVATLVIGLVGVGETAVRGFLIFTLPSEKVLLLIPLVGYGAAAVLLLFTWLYVVPSIRRGRELEGESSPPH